MAGHDAHAFVRVRIIKFKPHRRPWPQPAME
jgi:hypothetical protein